VKPIHGYQHLYFASIHRPKAEIFFASQNGFPIIWFICTIVFQPARMRKTALWPAPDAETHPKISGRSDGFSSAIPLSLLRGTSFQDTDASPSI